MRRKLATLAIGLTLVACEQQAATDAKTGEAAPPPGPPKETGLADPAARTDTSADAAQSELVLSVRYTDEEVSRDSNSEHIQISLNGSALAYELTRSGFGAEHSDDVHATVELNGDELALIEEWIAEGRLMQIASIDDGSKVDPGPHHRHSITIAIELRGEKHEFSLHGVESVKGSPTAFGRRDDLARAELFVTRLTALARREKPRLFEPRR
jgi:hypothetical protein